MPEESTEIGFLVPRTKEARRAAKKKGVFENNIPEVHPRELIGFDPYTDMPETNHAL